MMLVRLLLLTIVGYGRLCNAQSDPETEPEASVTPLGKYGLQAVEPLGIMTNVAYPQLLGKIYFQAETEIDLNNEIDASCYAGVDDGEACQTDNTPVTGTRVFSYVDGGDTEITTDKAPNGAFGVLEFDQPDIFVLPEGQRILFREAENDNLFIRLCCRLSYQQVSRLDVNIVQEIELESEEFTVDANTKLIDSVADFDAAKATVVVKAVAFVCDVSNNQVDSATLLFGSSFRLCVRAEDELDLKVVDFISLRCGGVSQGTEPRILISSSSSFTRPADVQVFTDPTNGVLGVESTVVSDYADGSETIKCVGKVSLDAIDPAEISAPTLSPTPSGRRALASKEEAEGLFGRDDGRALASKEAEGLFVVELKVDSSAVPSGGVFGLGSIVGVVIQVFVVGTAVAVGIV